MRLPDFLFLGTARAGTTSLAYYLKQHPKIYFPPVKELNFFSWPDYVAPGAIPQELYSTDLSRYEDAFRGAPDGCLIGEAATLYLAGEQAAERIHRHLPQVKMIAILRHPAERAYSNYQYFLKEGKEAIRDFEQALDAESLRKTQGWPISFRYAEMGLYAGQVERYRQRFPENQLRIYLTEDLEQRPDWLLGDIFDFLGLPRMMVQDTSVRVNVSGEPHLPAVYKTIRQNSPLKKFFRGILSPRMWLLARAQYEKVMLKRKPGLPLPARQRLLAYYKEDVLQLQNVLGRDLLHWLKT